MPMDAVQIRLAEDRGIHHLDELVQVGVPLERGAVFAPRNVRLTDNDQPVVFQASPTVFWPDGSIRWLTVSFLTSLQPNETRTLALHADGGPAQLPEWTPSYTNTDNFLRLELGSNSVELRHGTLAWQSRGDGEEPEGHYRVCLSDSTHATPSIKEAQPWRVLEQGPVYTRVQSEGEWADDQGNRFARYRCTLTFFNQGKTLAVDFCIHNPNRARHPGGLWDLGDPGSIHFRSLDIIAEFPEMQTSWVKERPEETPCFQPDEAALKLYQDSSGGENWQSRNHIDAEGNLTTRFRGYRLYSGANPIREGLRAEPIIGLQGKSIGAQASVKQFWQNFPSALSARGQELQVALFPADSATPYELQGGERKTQTAYFNLTGDNSALDWTQHPIVPVIPAAHYERAEAFPWFKADAQPGPLEALLRQGIDGPDNFFQKREVIDEYGWRNFGDVFADHETLYQKPGEAPYISHYNNQYDAIYGFARQFALTGDRRWFELMDDLARHVTDIDIYHTEEDRAEYNNGLFWHTDHYLDAHTATHRTFSRHNDTSSTPGQTGGGPGAEHCYTSGLRYHYTMTGEPASKEAALDLADWMRTAHEGVGGLLEQILLVKKNDLPKFKALLNRERPTSHRYPFTRGTGNYINALLDAWLLTGKPEWINQAERVIQATIHPADNIEKRNLLDVETGWHYLVLLSGLIRYLCLKQELGQRDEHYTYARDSLIHYTRWMIDNEKPFLENPDILEFPNDTWTAQDIRKAMIVFQAREFDRPLAKAYTAKGDEWLEHVVARLQQSQEAHYTRILVILMQNHGPQSQAFFALEQPETESEQSNQRYWHPSEPRLTWTGIALRVLGRLTKGLLNFNPAREKDWLNARLDR